MTYCGELARLPVRILGTTKIAGKPTASRILGKQRKVDNYTSNFPQTFSSDHHCIVRI